MRLRPLHRVAPLQVVDLAMQDPAIKDLLDVVLFVVVNDFRQRRGGRTTTGKGIRRHEGHFDDWKDRVVATHGEGELQLVGAMTDARCDFEGSKMSVGQFCG